MQVPAPPPLVRAGSNAYQLPVRLDVDAYVMGLPNGKATDRFYGLGPRPGVTPPERSQISAIGFNGARGYGLNPISHHRLDVVHPVVSAS